MASLPFRALHNSNVRSTADLHDKSLVELLVVILAKYNIKDVGRVKFCRTEVFEVDSSAENDLWEEYDSVRYRCLLVRGDIGPLGVGGRTNR